MSIAHDPFTDDGGDEQQHQHCDVENNDTQQQEEHFGGKFCSAEFLPAAQRDSCPRSSEWPQAQTRCVLLAAGVPKDSCAAGLRSQS